MSWLPNANPPAGDDTDANDTGSGDDELMSEWSEGDQDGLKDMLIADAVGSGSSGHIEHRGK